MAYNFPASPVEDQLFTPAGGPTYIYKAPRWMVQGIPPAYVSDAPDAQNYVRTLGAWVLGYSKAAIDTALGGKADNGHTHSYSSLTGIPSTFAPSAHGHPQSEITNLTTDLALLAPKASPTFSGTLNASVGIFASNLTAASFISGTYNVTGATAGIVTDSGSAYTIRHSTTGTASTFHQVFANGNGQVGDIRTNASATAFTTTSDENLKNFLGPYDPELAIAIIRADPVREYTWKADGSDGIGWGAQTSHAIDPHLALPPPEPIEGELRGGPGEAGYVPWTVDYGRRTPYLWAALARALDRIDELEARLAALEAG